MGHRHLPIRYLSIPSVADTLAAPRPGIRRAAVLPRFTHIQTRHARRILGHIAPLIAHAHSESARSVGGAFAYMLQRLGGRRIAPLTRYLRASRNRSIEHAGRYTTRRADP